jgi:uncharacterized protein YggE
MRNGAGNLLCAIVGAAILLAPGAAVAAQVHPAPPSLLVTGHARVAAAPDQVILRIGASIQARQAMAAQTEVNEIMQRVLAALRGQNIPATNIRTVNLSLAPVYEQPDPRTRPGGPRVSGYRAAQTVQIILEDVRRAGEVLDAVAAGGANHIEDPVFRLADETAFRQEALRRATRDARNKAEAIAEAMGVRLVGVIEATEGAVAVMPQRFDARLAMARDAGTPVEPGQVEVEATVTIRYRITEPGAPL